MKNKYLTVVVAVVIGLGGFYGGMKYQGSKTPEFERNLPEGLSRMRGGEEHGVNDNSGISSVRGEVIEISDSSITVKLDDDSSKIVILTDSTGINKSEEGSVEDLTEGTIVMVMGQTNSDGSVTAQNIQLGTMMFREHIE